MQIPSKNADSFKNIYRSKECRFLQEKSIYKFQEQIPHISGEAKHVTRIDARYVASVGKRDMYISSLTFLQWHVPFILPYHSHVVMGSWLSNAC